MENEKTVDVLNSLITINNDRIQGYQTASDETDDEGLKDFFSDLKSTSLELNEELSEEVIALGGKPSEGTKASGKFFRVWMDVKAALTGRDREAILSSCEYGEKMAQDAYTDALKEGLYLTSAQTEMIQEQLKLLRIDYEELKSMPELIGKD